MSQEPRKAGSPSRCRMQQMITGCSAAASWLQIPLNPFYPRNPRLFNLTRHELFQLHHIGREFPDPFGRFFVAIASSFSKTPKFLLVQLELARSSPLRFLGISLRSTGSFDSASSSINSGLIVRQIATGQLENLARVPETRAHHFGRDSRTFCSRCKSP